ncbi:MAG: hypothetical protein KDB23_23335 [Planctomycetales bacterium]|nr:hypothetical protein [Planctomycetales bacterium]
MNRIVVAAITAILFGLHFAHDAFFSQLGLSSGSSPSAWQNRHYYYLGVMFAQPAILSAWTWYGRGSFASRVRWSALIAFVLGNAVLFGVVVNREQQVTLTDVSSSAYPLVQYLTVLGLLAVAARFTRMKTPESNPRPQVYLKEMLCWIAILAIGLAGWSAILRPATVTGTFDISLIFELLLGSMIMGLMSAPIIATILMVTGNGGGNVVKWSIIFLVAQQMIWLTIGILTRQPLAELFSCEFVILITMHATAALTVWPFRRSDTLVPTPP